MYPWLEALLVGATAATILYVYPRVPPKPSGSLSKTTLEWTEGIRQKYDIQGISIGIVASPGSSSDSWRSETHGFGQMDEQGRPVDGKVSTLPATMGEDRANSSRTLLAMGSNSKLFAAIAIGILIENDTVLDNGKKLEYGTKIKDILPDWQLLDRHISDHVDVLDLLSMRSGMPRHDKSYGEEDASDILARLPHLRPSTELRQVMQYSNIHYWVIGRIVEHLSKDSYVDYIQTHILNPLGMSSSYYNHKLAEETGHRAEPFVRADKNSKKCKEASDKEMDMSCHGRPFATSWFAKGDGLFIASVGGLISSTEDMLVWLKELLDPTVISQGIIDETHKSLIPAWGETIEFDEVGMACYGQAQMTFNYRGHEVINHIGDVPGHMTHIARLPAMGIGIFLGFNDDGGHLVHTPIIYRLLDDLLGLEPIDWEERLITAARKAPSHVPIPFNPRPTPAIASLAGTYFDKGYGSLQIQQFDNPDKWDQSFLSEYAPGTTARSYFEAITKLMETQIDISSTEPLLFAHTGKLFVSAYVYTHFDGPIFNVSMINITQNKAGELAASSGGAYMAVFVEGEGRGMGMFGNFWGGRDGRKTVEENVEEEAEVWFSKTSD